MIQLWYKWKKRYEIVITIITLSSEGIKFANEIYILIKRDIINKVW